MKRSPVKERAAKEESTLIFMMTRPPALLFYLALLFLGLFTACDCGKGRPTPEISAFEQLPPPSARILWVSDPKGQLEPCGCTSRPLGGVDRLVGAIEEARSSAPSVLIFSGRIYTDGGAIAPDALPQKRLERDTFKEMLSRAEPDLIAHAAPRNEVDEESVSGQPLDGFFAAEAGDRELLFIYGPAISDSLIEEAKRAHPEAFALIAVHSGSRAEASALAQRGDVNFVLFASGEDEAAPPRALGGGHLLQAGDRGQRLLVLDLYGGEGERFVDESPISKAAQKESLDSRVNDLERRIAQWEAAGSYSEEAIAEQRARLSTLKADAEAVNLRPTLNGKRAFIAQLVEIDPAVEAARAISALMLAHDREVNAANALAFADTPPIPVPEGTPAYIGSSACASCHAQAYAWWEKTRHGRAYQTLVDRHKEFSMNCFQCHVTGYGEPGGATITFNLDGELKNVGCETCHGPGEYHARSPLEFISTMVRSPKEQLCRSCHDAEHSDQFDFEIYRARLLVPGHGL